MLKSLLIPLLLLVSPSTDSASPGAGTAPDDRPDRIVLKSGKEIECRVLFEGEEKIVYQAGRKREIPREDVAEIHSIERSMAEYLARMETLDRGDAQAIAALARWCEENDLLGEANYTWIRVLLADPENEEAWKRLGGIKSKRMGWRVKLRGRFVSVEELAKRLEKWKYAIEYRTAHYMVKSNELPRRAIDFALGVEKVHKAYYDVLSKVLPLYVFDEVPEIHIHVNDDKLPQPPAPGEIAWYMVVSNTLYVDATKENWEYAAVREMADLLTYNSFRKTVGKSGTIPAWVQEGLGAAFVLAVRLEKDQGGHFEFGKPYLPYFEAVNKDETPLKLSLLLGSGFGAFNAGSNAERLCAQAYILVQYLVHGENGKLRSGFAEYLRSAFTGKGAATHLRKALNMKEEEIERGLQAYVKEVLGK